MAYVSLTSAQCDANSPLDETLVQLIRTNLDDLDTRITAGASLFHQNIYDEFAGQIGTLTAGVGAGVDAKVWDILNSSAAGTVAIEAQHTLRINSTGDGGIAAAAGKIRIAFNEEYVAVYEARVKSNSSAGVERVFGFQDDSLAFTSAQVTDRTDCILFWIDNSDTTWRYINANGGVANNVSGMGLIANWTVVKLIVTCSATAGNRKIQAYVDGAEVAGSPFTTNLTTQVMRPIAFNDNQGANASDAVDYLYSYFLTRPLAP